VEHCENCSLMLTDVALSQLHGAEAQECDGVECHVQAVWVVGEGDQAIDLRAPFGRS
jgi:hypothetical protein